MKNARNTPPKVVLVDPSDTEIGVMEKMQAHRQGALHRAVSVFIFNRQGEWLLQRRTAFKYHSGGLWSNTCSTHPHSGETPEQAALRSLSEEMGLNCKIKELFTTVYNLNVDKGLHEYEYGHIFAGLTNELPDVNPREVWDWTFLPTHVILQDEQTHPEKYTPWFRELYQQVWKRCQKQHFLA